jgi:hypothetical protein
MVSVTLCLQPLLIAVYGVLTCSAQHAPACIAPSRKSPPPLTFFATKSSLSNSCAASRATALFTASSRPGMKRSACGTPAGQTDTGSRSVSTLGLCWCGGAGLWECLPATAAASACAWGSHASAATQVAAAWAPRTESGIAAQQCGRCRLLSRPAHSSTSLCLLTFGPHCKGVGDFCAAH